MNLKKLFLMLTFFVLLGTTAFAQTTWYVNNQTGNDGRNGLSATIPSPDDLVTGPKKTIGGAAGALAASNNVADIIIVANTGVAYSTVTGEPATITVAAKRTFRSTGGTVEIAAGTLLEINNAVAAPNNTVIFDNGAFKLSGGLTLTAGVFTNSSSLITVNASTITRSIAAATVTGQLLYSGAVNFSYGATMTTADEFVTSGGSINNLTTTAGNLTIKSGTNFTMTGLITTAGTLNLGGGVATITNSAGGGAHTVAGNVSNGTLAFQLGGAGGSTQTINGAFALPNVSVTTSNSNAQTLAIAQPTSLTGTLTVSNLASVTTSAALITIGTAGFTGDEVTLSGTGAITFLGAPTTINGNVLLNTALSTTAGATITFGAATTVNGNVTNNASLTVTNAATWNGINWGRIVFGNFAYTITGNVVNSTTIGGATGTSLDVDGFGLITFANIATDVTINGAINNTSSTSLASATNPTDFSGNGLITWGNNITTGIVRADGGINNSSNYSGLTGGGVNVNNGQIVIGGIARTGVSTVGTAANRVGLVTNSSVGAAANDGNGNITIGVGDNTSGGFFGTSVTVSGSAIGGYTTFGNESFNVSGNVINSRAQANSTLAVGVAAVATRTVTIGGNLENQSTGTITFPVVSTGAVAITGSINSSGTGTITFVGLTTGNFSSGGVTVSAGLVTLPAFTTGTFSIGALTVSGGTFTIPVTHTVGITITGNVNISGGAVNLLSSGGVPTIVSTGNSMSFTGGTITTTGVTSWTLNSPNITWGGASANPTFATVGTAFVVGNPSPTALTTVNIGAANPVLAGALTINNTTGLSQAVNITGGSLNVTGVFTITAGVTNIANSASLLLSDNFVNTVGYTTTEQGRVSMIGAGVKTFGGAGNFGAIEFNNAAGFATSSTVTLTGTVYLTQGAVANTGGAITFNNSTVLPTIVRNAGTLSQAPTFTSNVNVTYIGGDKTGGNELPPAGAPTKLQNLTVATTNGAVTGQGTVTVNAASTVNGTLQVNSAQTLLIDGVALTMKGASIILNGDIANEAAGVLTFGAATGTTVTGSGYLPNLTIASGSSGNVIAGTAVINQLVGTDNARGGGDDFNAATTAASGSITFGAGAAAASINFPGVAFDGTDAATITTAHASNALTLASNIQLSGNMTHLFGNINLGAFNLSVAGATPSIGTTATITGAGKLIFNRVGAQTFDLPSGVATIAANVEMNMDLAGTTLTLTTSALTLTGDVTLTRGTLTPTSGININGSNLFLTANSSVAGAGVLTFAPTGTLTVTLAGATTFNNLTVNGNVTLAGSAGALTITNVLTHTSGLINFADRDIIVGTLTRAAGTYSATTGYLQVNTALTQGAGFSIPNLRINGAMAVGSAQNFVVTDNLYLNGVVFTHTNGGSPRLSLGVASGAVPTVTILGTGNLDVAPTFAQGTCNYTFTGAVTPINVNATANYWPATPTTIANTVTVNMTNNTDVVQLVTGRTINGLNSLNLTKGILALSDNITLTLASGMTINKNANATLALDNDANTVLGVLSAPNVNLVYTGAQTAGAEYTSPTVVTNVTVNSTGGGLLTIANARTIAGDLTANHNVTITANTTVTGAISVASTRTLTITAPAALTVNGSTGSILGTLAGTGSVNFTSQSVTLGTFTNTGTIGFLGATGQTVNVPATGATMAGMVVNLTGIKPVLNVIGGNLTVTGGIVTFTNGIIDMGSNTLILDRPNVAGNSGLGFSRAGVTGTNVGHVVGKVQRAGLTGDGGAGINGRFEFPVGTLTGEYRPAAITFTPSYVLGNPVSIIISHVASSPEGTVGLPLNGGNSVTVGNYPAFYWLVSTTPSSVTSTQNFDLDLQANNIGVPYTSDQSLRIIRRQDGSSTSNGWLMQGVAANYGGNFQAVSGTDTTVVVRTTSSQGGLVLQGSRFAIGVPSRAPSFTAPALATFTLAEGATSANTIQFTAVGLNTNDGTIIYSKISGPAWAALNATTGLVTLTPGYTDAGTATLVVRATTATNLVAEKTVTITVTNSDQGPVLAAATTTVNPATASTGNGVAKTVTYVATDADAETVTYSYTVTPTPSTGSVVFSTSLGTLTFTPAYADVANSPFTFVITASSGTPALTAVVNTVFTVTNSTVKGDVNLSGGTITSADALLVLNYVVNPTVYPLTAEQLYAADVNNDGQVGAYDAASILVKAGGGNFLPKQAPAAGTVAFGKFSNEKGIFTLPINLENTAGVNSFYSEIQLGNSVEFTGVNSRLPEGWVMASNFENGTLKIAMAGLTPLTNGAVALVNLSLKDKDASVSIQGNAVLNDQLAGALNAVKVKEIPSEFSLSQNYPNPFNPTTSIKYAIAQDARVSLVVYNILGQAVRTLVNAEQESGYYTVRWDGTNDYGSKVSSGIYIYRISAGNFTSTVKMNLLK